MKLAAGEYYGNIRKSCRINGLIFSKSYYSIKPLPVHHHENPYFCYVLKGAYRELSRRDDVNCSKGDIIFHPSESRHSDIFKDSSSVCFNIELTGKWNEHIGNSGRKNITLTNSLELQKLILKIYGEICEPDSLSESVIESLMYELVIYFTNEDNTGKPIPEYIKRVTEYLNETYIINPTLAELSLIAGVTPEHLAREFKNKHRLTIGEYIRKLKVELALEKLKGEEKSLAQVAYETGFADQSHFTRTLRKVLGITPEKYRNIV